ncbi:MAG: flagellar protein FlgN [Magnetococcales bacterium]|nr:flagellar protein FlgN [Magnetococcales bacterium]
MSRQVEQLQEILQRLIVEFEGLQELLRQERTLIKERKTDAITAIAGRIDAALEQVRTVDTQRQGLTHQLARAMKLPPERRRLKDLDAALGGQGGLLALRDRLREVIGTADRLNRENQAAFKGVLGAMEALLHAVNGPADRSISYNRLGGREANRGLSRMFSRRL